MKYLEKFKDPRWQKKRLVILNRDNFTCQRCGDNKRTLNVHHRYYLPKTDPWEYSEDVLVTLCQDCHESEHEYMEEANGLLVSAFREHFFSDEIHDMACSLGSMKLAKSPELISSVFSWAFRNKQIQELITEQYFAYLAKRKEKATK